MRPQSNEPRKRLTSGSPVIAFTRTSQNIAPWLCIDQWSVSSGGGGAASTVIVSRWGPAEDRGILCVPFGFVELAQAAVAAAYLVGINDVGVGGPRTCDQLA